MNILLYILTILGAVSIVMGLILIVRCGIRGENTASGRVMVELFKGRFEVTGGTPVLAVALGIAMMLLPTAVIAHYRGTLGNGGLPSEVERRNKQLARTSKLQNGEFALSEVEVRIDLRKRKQISLREFFGKELSTTSRRVRAVIKDVSPDVKKIHFAHATGGYTIEPVVKPEGALWRVALDEKDHLYNPEWNLLRGEKTFADLLARKGRLDRSYSLSVPVVAGAGQQILYELTYYNGFQGRRGEWAGNAFIADTDIFTLYILFPKDKPFKTFKAEKGNPKGPDPFVEIRNPNVETDQDHRLIKWTVQNAKKGEAYVLRWDW